MASTTLRAGTMRSRTGRLRRSASAMTSERSRRSYARRPGFGDRLDTRVVNAQQTHRHHDHVAIAGGLERCHHMIEGVRIANGDQHISRAGIDVIEREIRGGKQIERVPLIADRRRRRLASDVYEPHARRADKSGCGKRRTVAERQHRKNGSHRYRPRHKQPQRNLAASETQIHGRAKWLRVASNPSQPGKRRNRHRQHRRDGDGVGSRQPCESTSAGHNQEHRRGGSDIGSARGRAEARVQRCEA